MWLKSAYDVWTIPNRHCPIEVLVNGYRASGQRTAEPALVELPGAIRDRYRVIFGDHAFALYREDPVQIAARRLAKGRSFLLGCDRELPIELADVVLAQERVGSLDCIDAG